MPRRHRTPNQPSLPNANSSAATGDPVGAASALRPRLSRRLLSWFTRFRRDLPWRRDRDPYRIWVSEVMLQQTQTAAVVPYFERFLQAFPTLAALAAADEQDVLRLWEGLGYYRRACDLLKTARLLAASHGRFPNDPDALDGLPGLGRYTRNAVLSQAFDRRLPILEAYSRRVLARLFGRTGDLSRGPEQRWLWAAAEALLPPRRAGNFNQALMELGALVCTPAAPRCPECPLAGDCAARRLGRQESIPARTRPSELVSLRGRRGGEPRRARAVVATAPGRTVGVALGVPPCSVGRRRIRGGGGCSTPAGVDRVERSARSGVGDVAP